MKVSIKDEGLIGRRLKDAMLSKGKPWILEKVKIYVQSMAKSSPTKFKLEVKNIASKA